MTDNDALNQTRDALHIAFALIANARNSLDNNVSNRDPVLADQWHEAAARFMQDYNANLDVYTGYRVRRFHRHSDCWRCSRLSRLRWSRGHRVSLSSPHWVRPWDDPMSPCRSR